MVQEPRPSARFGSTDRIRSTNSTMTLQPLECGEGAGHGRLHPVCPRAFGLAWREGCSQVWFRHGRACHSDMRGAHRAPDGGPPPRRAPWSRGTGRRVPAPSAYRLARPIRRCLRSRAFSRPFGTMPRTLRPPCLVHLQAPAFRSPAAATPVNGTASATSTSICQDLVTTSVGVCALPRAISDRFQAIGNPTVGPLLRGPVTTRAAQHGNSSCSTSMPTRSRPRSASPWSSSTWKW